MQRLRAPPVCHLQSPEESNHYETLVDTWNGVAFGGLELDGVTHHYELIANMIALQPGAALLVTTNQGGSALDVCGLIEREGNQWCGGSM